jgi:hypothetical protein
MARLTKAQKIEKAEQYVGLEPDPNLTSIQRLGRLSVAFNKKRQEFDDIEALIGQVIGSFLSVKPRGKS